MKTSTIQSKKAQVMLLMQHGRAQDAKPLLESIVRTDRSDADAWYLLGVVNHGAGELDSARRCYQRVVDLQPQHAEAHYYLGNLLAQQEQYDASVNHHRRALVLRPQWADAARNLGATLQTLKRHEEAAACYEQYLRNGPVSAEIYLNLGTALADCANHEGAINNYLKAIQLNPRFVDAYVGLGLVYRACSKAAEALNCFSRAIEMNPDCFEAHLNASAVHIDADRFELAIDHCERALVLRPGSPAAHANMGKALAFIGQSQASIAHYQRGLEGSPNEAPLIAGISVGYLNQGKNDEAIIWAEKALHVDPALPIAHGVLLMGLNYSESDSARIFAAHRNYGSRFDRPGTNSGYTNTHDETRPIRIGYVSPDFRAHSVAHFIEPVLAKHNKANVDVHCYSNSAATDPVAEQLRRIPVHWHDVHGQSDEDVVRLVQNDCIDILVDLAGHTSGNRLAVFGRKPAPIQVTYLGYPNTTGLATMDYRLTDEVADPLGQEAFHTERLMRLPHGFLCYQPPIIAPTCEVLPATMTGRVTFCSFNALPKTSPQTIRLWSQILEAVPGSRLMLKNLSLRDAAVRQRCIDIFAGYGIEQERLELIPFVPDQATHFALYNKADIALDPFPYNGTTTTCEALWMGVPVVTLVGERHAGRVGASLLTRVGLPNLIAEAADDYVRIAVSLATGLSRLSALRARLRGLMQASPLCRSDIFVASLEQAYREMWRRWCSDEKAR